MATNTSIQTAQVPFAFAAHSLHSPLLQKNRLSKRPRCTNMLKFQRQNQIVKKSSKAHPTATSDLITQFVARTSSSPTAHASSVTPRNFSGKNRHSRAPWLDAEFTITSTWHVAQPLNQRTPVKPSHYGLRTVRKFCSERMLPPRYLTQNYVLHLHTNLCTSLRQFTANRVKNLTLLTARLVFFTRNCCPRSEQCKSWRLERSSSASEPSAGSPTDTMLRLILPLGVQNLLRSVSNNHREQFSSAQQHLLY